MKTIRVPTCAITVYVAGDYQTARESMRRECFEEGLCVTVTPTALVGRRLMGGSVVAPGRSDPFFRRAGRVSVKSKLANVWGLAAAGRALIAGGV